MAPLIPTATYRSGATTLPVYPTYKSLETNPASTAALEAPTAAFPNMSANFSNISKFSLLFIPLPPDTIIFAAVNSGLSLYIIWSLTYYTNY
mmetsp:Transcript_123637/g.184912  ORF Transcript_123637/g.184912 Transcript_123637/m.184912 type:complete len:92 (+) Transcript_123637:199-474(+)